MRVPVPTKQAIVDSCIAWRNHNQTGIIDDLRRHLRETFNCEFWALGYGTLEDFLTEHKFTVVEIKTKVVFNPVDIAVKKPETDQEKNDENECIICMEEVRNSVVSACGHFCMCMECALNLDKCPVCRVDYNKSQVLKVFLT